MSRKDGITEREFIIGERVLQDFKSFFKQYNENLSHFTKKLPDATGSYTAPCSILSVDREDRDILSFVESDNKILSKIILCLASLCNEMDFIVKETQNNLMKSLFCYGDGNIYEHPVKRFGNIISKLLRLRFTLKRCQQIIKLLLKQMCAILGKAGPTNTILFPEALERLSDLLVCILILDSILASKALSDHLQALKRILKTYDTGTYIALPALAIHNIQSLNDRLTEIEAEVLNGALFSRTIESSFDESIIAKKKACNLPEQFVLVIMQSLADLEKEQHSTISFQQSLLHVNVLAVFNHYLAGSTDKKLIRRISNLNRKTVSSCFVLNGNVVWNPQTFLNHHLKLDKGTQTAQSLNPLKTTNILLKESKLFSYQTCAWLIELDLISYATCSRINRAGEVRSRDLRRAHNTLLQGMNVCERVRDALARQIAQMSTTAARLRRADTAALCHLLETLQAARLFTVQKTANATAAHSRLLAFTRQHTTHKALSAVAQLKRNIREEKKYKNEQLDILSTLSVLEHSLKGPNSMDRILIAKLALSASALNNEEKSEIRQLLNKLDILCQYNAKLNQHFDVSIMQCYKFIFDVYIVKTMEAKLDMSRIQLCAKTMAQCAQLLPRSLADALSGHIETRLRLQTHAHLQRSAAGGEPQPLVPCAQLQSLGGGAATLAPWFLTANVESRLSAIFYNLTTVVLHDWRTYGEMRRLAARQFALQTVDDNLPMHTLDQGLDILEIMRNIDVFVAKYLYNMNDHVFVQAQSNNKHLNTVNITHVANSIRTHGIGIMSTAVNFTYQFLQKKFYTFSQFMFDEHIKSKLLKEIRFFAENKTDTNELYPYENADKFNTDIRKLGIDSNGLSYLDLFRILITQIGNALGYIRLVKAGGERCLADATCLIPNLQTIDEIIDLIGNDPSDAADYLRKNLNIIVGNFQQATEYFKLLINVFAPVLLDKNNHHLRNFYMIIPPLTINFVEYSLTCKDRLNKRNRDGASFTDDGFAMGVTYVTVLLKQTNILNSLHWPRSVKTKFVRDRESLRKQIANASKEDAKLQQTLTLSEKRIASIEREFQLLMYNLSNAQIFFQKGNV